MDDPNDELIGLAWLIVEVLDRRSKAGRIPADWSGYSNGEGVEVGSHIEELINKAKTILQTHIS